MPPTERRTPYGEHADDTSRSRTGDRVCTMAIADLHPTDTGTQIRSAAFFDLDNTLVQGASLFHLARGLTAHDMVSKRQIAGYALRQAQFRLLGERATLLEDVREHALDFIKGHEVVEMEKICASIYEDYLADKIWPGTR